ncbi:MAG TPA: SPOR domain-containing protein [Lysobacter sp.]|nr:SPOR domain-containing protein [Lysobacter sp.]
MAAKRGKSQARRNSSSGVPGWAWLIAGLVLGAILIIAAPRFLKSDGADGFFRPKPNPDAKPVAAASAEDDDAIVPEGAGNPAPDTGKAKSPTYDFYTMLPGNEVVLSDAELAASERAEAEREAARAQAALEGKPVPAVVKETPAAATPAATTTPATKPVTTSVASTETTTPAATPATTAATTDNTHYLLQAGAFQASGDAEAVKAKIALLGLSARVESAQIKDKTVYRVRMGPYGTASELAEAKRKLSGGGLPAMAIKAN